MLIFPLFAQDHAPYSPESGRFENPYCDEDQKPTITDMVRWKFSYHILQKPFITDDYRYEVIPTEYVNPPERFHGGMITWVGHSTYLIQVDGINILTDPVWSERVGLLGGKIGHQRYTPPGVPWEKLPPIDVVIISHNHYDHLDKRTITRLYDDFEPVFLVPMGVKEIVEGWRVAAVHEFYWWESYRYSSVEFIATPAQHQSQRSLTDKNATLWSGWGIRATDLTFYFAGDTGYFEGFRKIRHRLGPIDVAMIPIGAYEPRWYNGAYHLDPGEALLAFEDLNARYFAAMHWGTFDQAEEMLGDPPRELLSYAAQRGYDLDTIWVFAFGESRAVPPREKEERIIYTLDMLDIMGYGEEIR
jgi:N-acyl-phosphatidylethanolamine-hydrolysing phospholipase D